MISDRENIHEALVADHRQQGVSLQLARERIVELERENAELRRQLASGRSLHLSSFPHGP